MNIKDKIAGLLSASKGEWYTISREELLAIADEFGISQPDKLRMARASKAEDVRHITAEDALLDALRLVRKELADETQGVRCIALWEVYKRAEADGESIRWERCAQVTRSRVIAMLERAKLDNILSPRERGIE